MTDYKLAIIGSKDAIAGFSALGVETLNVLDADGAKKALLEVTEKDMNFAVVFITEEFAMQVEDEIAENSSGPLPAIVPIPSYQGSKGAGTAKLRRIVEQAVGSDILFKN
ncbi:MAG: V-type ATP synthase subunit F [bacterium]